MKGIAGRARPQLDIEDERSFVIGRGFKKGDVYRSFPSGHSAMGFAAAAAVTSETSKWWPHSTWYIAPVMYGGATMIAASRMYNNKHWASDVVMGAAIGTFAGTKVVRYHHSHPGNRIDKWLLHPTCREEARWKCRGGGGISNSLRRSESIERDWERGTGNRSFEKPLFPVPRSQFPFFAVPASRLRQVQRWLDLPTMTRRAVDDRVRPLEVRDVLEQVVVDASPPSCSCRAPSASASCPPCPTRPAM